MKNIIKIGFCSLLLSGLSVSYSFGMGLKQCLQESDNGKQATSPVQEDIKALCKDEQVSQQGSLSQVSSEVLTMAYSLIGVEHLLVISSEFDNLQNLFNNNQLVTGVNFFTRGPGSPWDEKKWSEAATVLNQRKNGQEEVPNKFRKKINFDKLPNLLLGAKSILGSFVPSDTVISNYSSWRSDFMKKTNPFRRLLTYAQLQRVIAEENLTHVRLPFKMLLIQDKLTGNYVARKCALDILNDITKIMILSPSDLETKIDYYSDTHELHVFAQKKERVKNPLNNQAFGELKALIQKAPFDVGDDNIFSDNNGDAIIIDTEFMGESAKSSLAKLERYSH
ncbi:MAG: hypothetical protein WC707_03810 [Candidatus Babeliaceae bacterium]